MKNKTVFFSSFVIVVLLHTYVLSSYKVDQQIYEAQSGGKVSFVVNLQQVSAKASESVDEPAMEEIVPDPIEEPVIEETVPDPIDEPVIEEIPLPEPKLTAEEKVQEIPKPIKKKESLKKKQSKNQKIKTKNMKSASEGLSGGQISGSGGGGALKENYYSKVRNMIERKKRYPSIAKKLRQEGIVHVTFTISKNGAISDVRLVKKCSHERLNRAAVRVLKEIGSFPPIPEEVGKQSISLSVLIRYKILN